VLDYVVHCSSNETKTPGTITLRLAAIRSMHLTLGYPDPLAHMPRVPLALAGLRRRYGTKKRRMPVTPDMLRWLGNHLQYGRPPEAGLLWGRSPWDSFSCCVLLSIWMLDTKTQSRAQGSDITLKLNGKALASKELEKQMR
jgi:hypothetical protein